MLAKSFSTKKIFSLLWPGWDFPDRAFFIFYGDNETQLSCIGGLDVGHLHIEVEGLSGQRVVESTTTVLSLTSWTRMAMACPLRSFRHAAWRRPSERPAESCLWKSLGRALSNHIRRAPSTGYCWVLMLSAGALELLLGIRPFIE